MKTLKRYLLLSICIVLSLSIISCGEANLQSSKEDLTAVKTISDIEIPLEVFRYVAMNHRYSYEYGASGDIWEGEDGAALLDELNADIEKTLLQMYTPIVIAKDYGIDPDDQYFTDMVDVKMEEIYESYGYDYDIYLDEMANYYMNDSVYRFLIKCEILADEIVSKMMEAGDLPSDTDEIKEVLLGSECVRVKQILIASDNGKTYEENLALAEQILSQIENGADFDKLVKEYGEDLYMFNNSDGYYVTRGNLHETFEETAFSLEVGEVSGMIETDAGLSILKRYKKDSAYIEKHIDTLASEYVEGLYNIALEEYSKKLTISDTENSSKYSVLNLK